MCNCLFSVYRAFSNGAAAADQGLRFVSDSGEGCLVQGPNLSENQQQTMRGLVLLIIFSYSPPALSINNTRYFYCEHLGLQRRDHSSALIYILAADLPYIFHNIMIIFFLQQRCKLLGLVVFFYGKAHSMACIKFCLSV